jgi:hypothetical protein
MALEIGLISSVITVADVAWKSCKALHDLIDGIREAPQQLLYLHTDLEEVGRTLKSFADLDRLAAVHENAQYRAALQHSLEQLRPCIEELGSTCDTFRTSLNEVFRHSTSDRTSSRDRFSFQFQEGNIQRFRDRMASYKNTLTVALGLASLAATSSNAQDIGSLEELVKSTHGDLTVQLKHVEAGLDSIAIPIQTASRAYTDKEANAARDAELTFLRSQKLLLEDCLKVCSSASQGVQVKHAEALDDARHFIGNIGDVKAGGPPVIVERLLGKDRARQAVGNIDGPSALAFLNAK